MITVDMQQLKELERDLKTFARRAYPFATKSTINGAAFTTQKVARRDINVKMITRNKFTEQSVRVEQTRTLNVNSQAAVVGSIADYMADQEFGGFTQKTGKEGVAIPTSFSAGQGKQQPRTKLPRKANQLANIRLKQSKKRRPKNRRQAVVFAIQDAVNTSNRYIYLELSNNTKGIFKVTGGRRGIKRGTGGARIKMVYDLSRMVTPIPRNPWLKPAVDHVQQQMPAIYFKALTFQAKRLGLFK